MRRVHDMAPLREQVARWKERQMRVGFVPTMGNLHAGHLALVARARQAADKVVVSIFVNPTQFAVGEDFDRYPRTPAHDAELLERHGVDLLFTPTVTDIYGDDPVAATVCVPDALKNMLCGLSRVGHFDGVATVVEKLFRQVQPDVAVFGEKDFQQLAVIRWLVRHQSLPIEIIAHETVREADGLAMSSRNHYLSAEQRQLAAQLNRTLLELVDRVQNQALMHQAIDVAVQQLSQAGFDVEYVEIRRQADLKPPEANDKSLIALAAVKLGETRLIDNRLFQLNR